MPEEHKQLRRKLRWASIVPGLGLWLLGHHKYAVYFVILMLASIGLAFYFPTWGFYAVLLIFVLQGSFVGYALHVQDTAKDYQQPKTQDVIFIDGENLEDQPRMIAKVNKILYPQLDADDYLIASLNGVHIPKNKKEPQGQPESFAIGVTDTTLIIVGIDLLGKAAYVNRVPIAEIVDVKLSKKIFMADVTLKRHDGTVLAWTFTYTGKVKYEVDKLVAVCKAASAQ